VFLDVTLLKISSNLTKIHSVTARYLH